jgi:hypothetical protein
LRPSLILSLMLVIGCGPGVEPGFETEHLSFHGELDGACGSGLGVLFEREHDRIEHALGRGLLEPLDVYVGYDEIDRRCPPGTSTMDQRVAGCVVSDTAVVTTWEVLDQMLVTQIRRQHDVRGIPFIERALPLMLGLGRPTTGLGVTLYPDPDYAIDEQLAYGWSDEALVDGTLALHFLHWVESTYPSQAYQAWLWSDAVREGVGVQAAFTAAMGQTLDAAKARWSDEADFDAAFDGFCHGTDAPPLPAEGLVVEASACCGDPGVEQAEPPLLNLGRRCFTLPTDTTVDVELIAGDGDLVLRPDGCSETQPSPPLVVGSGEATTVTMTACRWRAMVVGPEQCEGGEAIRYAIEPA